MIALLDNTVMSNFAVGRPDLLRIAFGDTLATSRQAFAELKTGVSVGKLPDLDWQWLSVWTLDATARPSAPRPSREPRPPAPPGFAPRFARRVDQEQRA